MGIRGRVYCRCHAEGNTPEPPVPVRVTTVGEVVPASDTPGTQPRFVAWARDACPHPGWLAAECDLSWLDIQRLLQLVNDYDRTRFAGLMTHVPAWPGQWFTGPDNARDLLTELAQLHTAVGGVAVDQLFVNGERAGIWTRRGEPLWLWRRAPEVVGLSGRGSLAVWADDDVSAAPTFEAARVRQRPAQEGRGVDLTHVDTGATHRVSPALLLAGDRPDAMEVRWTQLTPDEYCAAIPALRHLWQTSVDLDNPALLG